MRPKISYITYATSSHEQTGIIINFAQFEEGNVVENERNAEEDKSILDFIDESSTYDDSDDEYISTNAHKYIGYGNQIHQEINARDSWLKICDCIRKI